jgi:tetratricopeptide (TPR) repeat protein
VIAAGAASFVLSGDRFRSRDRMWQEAVRANPGNEAAALAVAKQQRQSGDAKSAHDTLVACAKSRPDACTCEEAADADAIDIGLYSEARASLEAPSPCPRTARRLGLIAESLVGTGAIDDGLHQAELAIAADPNDAHAAYARAWGLQLKGQQQDAKKYAEQAVALQRGLVANLLLGLIDFQLGDLDAASAQFKAALAVDPTNVQATYDTALVAQKKNQYHDAREGYLRTLKLDPAYADAHFNLIVLTFNAGAVGEAQHHLEQFSAKCPTDPRLPQLRGMLARAGAQR